MKILSLKLDGFRRFSRATKLDCSGRILALLGPNEAGKSSVLDALQHLNNSTELSAEELSRDRELDQNHICIEALYELETDDIDNFRRSGIIGVKRLKVSKAVSGARFFDLEPELGVDSRLRRRIYNKIKSVLKSRELEYELANALQELSGIVLLEPSGDTEETQQTSAISTLLEYISEDDSAHNILKLGDFEIELLQLLNSISYEHFMKSVESICDKRIPEFIFFDDEGRNLLTRYNLDSYFKKQEAIPRALQNLANVCELDLRALWTHLKHRADGQVATMIAQAQDKLDDLLKSHWAQAEIRVRFFTEGPVLKIQIEDPGRIFSSLGERSDGLRQFISLLVFTVKKRAQKPVLLIDEAEMHLHYDGQADLIQMLEAQRVSSKVIYTTHSLGCLPEDLGKGVRIISVDGLRSRFINWFWEDGNVGFSPVLMGIGAQTLAFFPVRRAVLSEGPSDMLLLPSLIREASGRANVGYQIVPGLAQAGEVQIKSLCNEGKSVAYIVDGDTGGSGLRDQLLKAGVAEDKIRLLGGKSTRVRTIEDLIDVKHLVSAVNLIIGRRNLSSKRMKRSDIDRGSAADSLRKWCDKVGIHTISKRELAYQLLDLAADNGDVRLLPGSLRKTVKALDKWIISKFNAAS